MPGPMPAQGGAPQGAPAPQAPQPQAGGAQQLVSQIHDGITKLKGMVGGADPQLKQAFAGLENAFQAFVEDASKPAGAPPGPPQAGPQPVKPPMPANASPNSRPMPPGQ